MTQQQISKLTGAEATKLMSILRKADNTTVNLYTDFGGAILYNKMEGMDSVGESKNAYTEEYADAEQLRTYMPDVVHNKATTVKLTLDFIGENRSFIKESFMITGLVVTAFTARVISAAVSGPVPKLIPPP